MVIADLKCPQFNPAWAAHRRYTILKPLKIEQVPKFKANVETGGHAA